MHTHAHTLYLRDIRFVCYSDEGIKQVHDRGWCHHFRVDQVSQKSDQFSDLFIIAKSQILFQWLNHHIYKLYTIQHQTISLPTVHTSSPTSYFLALSIPTSVEYIVVFSGWVVALYTLKHVHYLIITTMSGSYHLHITCKIVSLYVRRSSTRTLASVSRFFSKVAVLFKWTK